MGKACLKILACGLVMWGLSRAFPQSIIITGFPSLIIAMLVFGGVATVIGFCSMVVAIAGGFTGNGWLLVGGLIAMVCCQFIAVAVLDALLPGLAVHGFWGYIMVIGCFALCGFNS